ncbi:hypothetical protein KO361_01770 [Candidatus Woesearchaeota archaeon]|nr:hypothetical protein [Candidatus Woesearchaeota archaeon]
MGILDVFKKKPNLETEKINTENKDLGMDPFKTDQLTNLDSGLNLPKNDYDPINSTMQMNTASNQFTDYKNKPYQKMQETNNNYNQQPNETQKDLQIIIAKLDALRAEVQTINHKIEKIEEKQQKRMW